MLPNIIVNTDNVVLVRWFGVVIDYCRSEFGWLYV